MKLLVVCSCGSVNASFHVVIFAFRTCARCPSPWIFFVTPFVRVNPIREDGSVEVRRAKPDIMGKDLVVLRLREPLVGTFWSKYVCQLLTLFVCSNEIGQRNRKSSHQLGQPTNALTNTHAAQLVGVEPNSESSYCQHSTSFSPLEDLWGGTDWARLQHIHYRGPPSQRGDQKVSRRGAGCTSKKSKYNNTEKKHLHFHMYRQLATSYIKIFSHVSSHVLIALKLTWSIIVFTSNHVSHPSLSCKASNAIVG